MAITPAFDIAAQFATYRNDIPLAQYRAEMQATLDMIDKIELAISRFKITDQKTFETAKTIKGKLCSLSCYTFNNNLPENDKVWEIESMLAKKMRAWTLKNLASSEDNLLIRYLLWNKRYSADKKVREWIIDRLIEKKLLGFIIRDDKKDAVVRGIHCKVGDNTFTGNSRRYVHCCEPQCFHLEWDMDVEYVKTKDLPELPSTLLNVIYLQDGKGSARHPKITRQDLKRLMEIIPADLRF